MKYRYNKTEKKVLNILCNYSEKGELGPVVAARVDQITAELKSSDGGKGFDPVEHMKAGFIHFKTEKYE